VQDSCTGGAPANSLEAPCLRQAIGTSLPRVAVFRQQAV